MFDYIVGFEMKHDFVECTNISKFYLIRTCVGFLWYGTLFKSLNFFSNIANELGRK